MTAKTLKPVPPPIEDFARPAVPPWQQTAGMLIAGQAEIDEVDKVAGEVERRWGIGRARLLASVELREKFDRQRYLLNRAIWHGDLEAVRREARRSVKAWEAVRAAAEAVEPGGSGSPLWWEVEIGDGCLAAICGPGIDASQIEAGGRFVAVFELEEIGRLIEAFPTIAKAKQIYPGARVEGVRQRIGDPLDAIGDTAKSLNDPFPF